MADGRVFVGARDGFCYAFDVQTTAMLWSRQLTDVIVGSPLYADGKLFISSGGFISRLYWLDPVTGQEVDHEDPPSSELMVVSPTMMGSQIIFGHGSKAHKASIDEVQQVLNVQWSSYYETDCYLRSSPAVSGTRIYLGDGSAMDPHGIVCLGSTLDQFWGTSGGGYEWTCGTAALHEDSVFVPGGKDDPDIYCLKDLGSTYELVWATNLDAYQAQGQPVSPAVADDWLFMAVTRLTGTGMTSVLCCLDPKTGMVRQEFELGLGRVVSSPAIWDGKIYIGTRDGRLLCFG